MTSIRDALTAHLDRATAMRDVDAARVLRATLDVVREHDGDARSDAPAVAANQDADLRVLRQEIDARSRAAGHMVMSSPEAAAALRREAEVLTIVLASAEG